MWINMFGNNVINQPKNYDRGVNCRYINGETKNKKFCSAFCNCHLHRGYLTEKMIKDHKCIEKECSKLYVKVAEPKQVKHNVKKCACKGRISIEEINAAIVEEGVKFIKAELDDRNVWILKYVSISSFDEKMVDRSIKTVVKGQFTIQKKECDFDTAVRIVMG